MTAKPDFKKHPKTEFKDARSLSKKEARQQMEAVRLGIDYQDFRYYVKNDPVISDAAYDKLFRRLEELEEAFPDLAAEDSPAQRVGAEPADELESAEHAAPMLSLRAVLEEDEVERFGELVRRHADGKEAAFVAEPKFDGVSIEAVYEKGRYRRGATRGDGRTGEDVTANLKTIRMLPLRLQGEEDAPDFLSVRGEVYFGKREFQDLNKRLTERGDRAFANPRNAASGTLRRLDPREVARKPLAIVFYDILETSDGDFTSHWDELDQLARWGLRTDEHNTRCGSIEEIRRFHRRLAEGRDDLPYDIDGIVIKVDDRSLWHALGTRHRSPRWALAWKFQPRREVTRLSDIVVQVGMTGVLTPVAMLDPVDVGGVTVSRATLHNEDEVRRKDIRTGDKVRVARAGDVIPEVVERIKEPGRKRSEEFVMPRKCPVCNSKVVREGAYHLCPAGLSCPPQLVGHIVHYGSKEALDIAGLGKETARHLVDKELVRDLADLYRLEADDLLRLEGFSEKSARKLHHAIQGAKRPPLDRFLFAQGIRHVGRRVARDLAQAFGSLDAIRRADTEEVGEIGPVIGRSVQQFFGDKATRDVLERLQQAGLKVQDMPSEGKDQPLAGKTFVFTGNLKNHTRDEAKDRVEGLGARATSSVSGKTDYVVVGDNPGSKLDDARENDVDILDESAFEEMLTQ